MCADVVTPMTTVVPWKVLFDPSRKAESVERYIPEERRFSRSRRIPTVFSRPDEDTLLRSFADLEMVKN